MLTSVPGCILSRIIQNRIKHKGDEKPSRILINRSTIDHITTLVNIIKSINVNRRWRKCNVQRKTIFPFEIKTGVKQGCLLSQFLFLLVIDWIMKGCDPKDGIQSTLREQLNDLDFADDLCYTWPNYAQGGRTWKCYHLWILRQQNRWIWRTWCRRDSKARSGKDMELNGTQH